MLTGATPRLTTADAVEIGATLFGVRASAARDLGSERDRTFMLDDVAILKVSNAAEDPDVLDMEAAAALHVHAVDPELGVALPREALAGGLRARWGEHWVRLYDVLPGNSRIEATALSDAALREWGATTARLGVALRGFTHPKAVRVMAWDVQHALDARAMLSCVGEGRDVVERVLDAFEARVTPVWPRLRAQVAHTDLTVDNTLTDDDGFITGVIDFGDMAYTALITDLASVLDSVCGGRSGDELFRAARLVLDGYQRRVLLEEAELEALGVCWAARSAVTVAISSWRVAQGLEERAWAERYNAVSLQTLATMETLGWDAVARALGAEGGAPAGPVAGGAAGERVRARGRPAVLRAADRGGVAPRASGSPTRAVGGCSTRTTTSRASGTRTRA